MKRSLEFGHRCGRALDDWGEAEVERRLVPKSQPPRSPHVLPTREELLEVGKDLEVIRVELAEAKQKIFTRRKKK